MPGSPRPPRGILGSIAVSDAFVIQYAPMTTHRSLTKLEFKAHMSIHNVAEVPAESSPADVCATRDRFGRKHEIRPVPRSRKAARTGASLTLAVLLAGSIAAADEGFVPADKPAKPRSTNMTVESDDRRPLWAGDTPQEPSFAIPIDDKMALEINDDGDPNVNYRF